MPFFSNATSEELLRGLLRRAHTKIHTVENGSFPYTTKLHVNLEAHFHPEVGDYGRIDSNGKFVKEGHIYNPIDGSIIPGFPSPFYGLQADNEFMRVVSDTPCEPDDSSPSTLRREGIDEVFLKENMASVAKKVFDDKGEKPAWRSSFLRHLIPGIGENNELEKVQVKSPSDLLLLCPNYVTLGFMRFNVISSEYSVYWLRKPSKWFSASMVFFTGREKKFMNKKVKKGIRKIRPDLKGKTIVTETMSCSGFLVYESYRSRETLIDIHISAEEANPENPVEKSRKWKIMGDGLQDARIWSTMSHIGNESTYCGTEKIKCGEHKRRTVLYETVKI
ncbi:hypothetical protein BDQ17DRAFT_1330987 [Cyathus striatus]|nr:hypothetical protein BDQ17DRAFT_1330987 [Cyathus striatus]